MVRRPFVRRTVAFLALLGVVAMPSEVLTPDVHDGDFGRSVSVLTAEDAGAPTSRAPEQGPDLPSSNDQAPGHTSHAEHCGHAHVFVLAPAPSCPAQTALPVVALRGLTVLPASVPRSPEQRPPIA